MVAERSHRGQTLLRDNVKRGIWIRLPSRCQQSQKGQPSRQGREKLLHASEDEGGVSDISLRGSERLPRQHLASSLTVLNGFALRPPVFIWCTKLANKGRSASRSSTRTLRGSRASVGVGFESHPAFILACPINAADLPCGTGEISPGAREK